MSSQVCIEFPSNKMGQLLGYRGITIQKVKERSGVQRLHIPPDQKEKAKYQATIPIELGGTSEQINHCRALLNAVCLGDQSELGHSCTTVSVEPSVIGKLMGFKGKTVKELTDATGAYIEIQQDRNRGMTDTPQLFVAGPPQAVESAVALVQRFIASPGASLSAVLHPANATVVAPTSAGPDGQLVVFDPEGPKEERIIEVPARRKAHLLGLKGQTIELVRQISGVIKCHIMADRDRGAASKVGTIPVQIFGSPDRVAMCVDIIEGLMVGDYSGLGHTSEFIAVEASKVDRLRGDRWQVINTLKELTSTYVDVLQGPEDGLPVNETVLMIAGPVDCVERSKTIVTALLQMMDRLPADGKANPEALGDLINSVLPPTNAAPALGPIHPVPTSSALASVQAPLVHQSVSVTHSFRSQVVAPPPRLQPPALPHVTPEMPAAVQNIIGAVHQLSASTPGGLSNAGADVLSALSNYIGELAVQAQANAQSQPQPSHLPAVAAAPHLQPSYVAPRRGRSRSPRRAPPALPPLAPPSPALSSSASALSALLTAAPTSSALAPSSSPGQGLTTALVPCSSPGHGLTSTTLDFPSAKLGQLLGYKGLTIQKVKDRSGVARLHIPPAEKERAKFQAAIPIEVAGTTEQVDFCRFLLDAVCNGDQTELGHTTTHVAIEPSVIGKIMGYKGKTVKELTETTGAYIEIQQDRARGMSDTPQLFVAGPAEAVENAVGLIQRFIASPGAKLEEVLIGMSCPMHSIADMSTLPDGQLAVLDPEGPKEERIVNVPARRKGHLLGLKGQTIELIRQTSGVIKCHIMADRDRGYAPQAGEVPVQVFGAPDRVAYCCELIERIVQGDHSGIGHATDIVPLEPSKADRLKGDRWQVINTLKELTSTYMDLLQGSDGGLQPGEVKLFMSGPPGNVERARNIINALLALMDQLPHTGPASPEMLSSLLGGLALNQPLGLGSSIQPRL